MKIIDNIRSYFFRRWQAVRTYVTTWGSISCYPYGETIYRNIVELLTDLCNDVQWVNLGKKDNLRFAEFKVFFERDGQTALWRCYKQGYAVIGVKQEDNNPRFRLFDRDEYHEVSSGDNVYAKSKVEGWETHVIMSEAYRETGHSDYDLCQPFVKFLDNLFNASNTSTEKMGTFIVASPETPSGYPTRVVLNKPEKEELEKQIAKEYGALSKQRHIMLLPQGMNFETISLEGIDRKLAEKVRLCVLAICDRIKVPANQVAIIDADSSKTLSNGSELREGDFNKYQSFERLLNRTFMKLAMELGMNVTYNIYNKPIRNNGSTI